MKKQNFKSLITAVVVLLTMGSCSEEFIEMPAKGTFLESNYYQNEDQAFAGLVAVYDVMRKHSGGFENLVTFVNAASDDHVAGGGGATDGVGIQSFSNFTINQTTIPQSYWSDYYQGIFRANYLLSRLPEVPMDEDLKARFAAEAKALRASYYFDLVRLFRNIPLILEPLEASEFNNVPQAAPAEVWAQIEQDLTEAQADLPVSYSGADIGRATKGAALGLLGKAHLQQREWADAATRFAMRGDSLVSATGSYALSGAGAPGASGPLRAVTGDGVRAEGASAGDERS